MAYETVQASYITGDDVLNDTQPYFAEMDETGSLRVYATWIGRSDISYTVYYLQEDLTVDTGVKDFLPQTDENPYPENVTEVGDRR